jgi:hypothetical protein
MRYLMAGLALLAGTGATVAAPTLPSPRDGAWLDNGIQQYVRYNAHQVMSEKETTDATTVSSYICAVVDLEKSLVQRATLLSGAVDEGKKKRHLDPKLLEGMSRTVSILIPLADTKFGTQTPTCERAILIVQAYLEKYPEMLGKDADVIVERALLDAYTENGSPSGNSR